MVVCVWNVVPISSFLGTGNMLTVCRIRKFARTCCSLVLMSDTSRSVVKCLTIASASIVVLIGGIQIQ